MDKLLLKLKSWIQIIQAAVIGIIVVEAVLVIIIGIASGRVGEQFDIWMWILLFCSFIYVFILVIKTAYQIKFPGSIIDEMTSKRELEVKNRLLDRQKTINEFITTAIQSLNEQTCIIDTSGSSENLCDKELETRLADLLSSLVKYTDLVFDSNTSRNFTIGIHFESYLKYPNSYSNIRIVKDHEGNDTLDNWGPLSDRGLLVFKDDLEIRTELLPKDLLFLEKPNGAVYEIESAIRKSLFNLSFVKHDFDFDDESYSIFCSEIPDVCSDEYVNGVLFIVCKKLEYFPDDLVSILKIFNRVCSNYTSKYNSCIIEKVMIKVKAEEERVSLGSK